MGQTERGEEKGGGGLHLGKKQQLGRWQAGTYKSWLQRVTVTTKEEKKTSIQPCCLDSFLQYPAGTVAVGTVWHLPTSQRPTMSESWGF